MPEVAGAAAMVKSIAEAAEKLGDGRLEAAVAAVIAPAAHRRTPRRTGALASTVRADGPLVTAGASSVRYAGPVHSGVPSRGIPARPFITEAYAATYDAQTKAAEAEVQKLFDQIKGA